jgi:hypothetical protein
LVKKYQKRKDEMVAEAGHLRDQIHCLSKKMFKDPKEVQEFLTLHCGFTEPTIKEVCSVYPIVILSGRENTYNLQIYYYNI